MRFISSVYFKCINTWKFRRNVKKLYEKEKIIIAIFFFFFTHFMYNCILWIIIKKSKKKKTKSKLFLSIVSSYLKMLYNVYNCYHQYNISCTFECILNTVFRIIFKVQFNIVNNTYKKILIYLNVISDFFQKKYL